MHIQVEGPAGVLEARLEEPDGREPRGAAVICHPHPLHGGSLENTICVRAARALRANGLATLRFNFRGVGASAGVHDGQGGEEKDVQACLDELVRRYPGLPQWGVGYSFGARTVGDLAARERRIVRVILIALPVGRYGHGRLAALEQPGLLLFGELDEFGTAADAPPLGPGLEVNTIEGADHLFRGRTSLVEDHVRDYARSVLG